MAPTPPTQPPTKPGGWYHFKRSNYVTWVTDWLLGFGGKSAYIILIFTTLYMSAELYPGVSLPPALNMAVFLIQMFALDMGGMGLASLARQARADGNETGAEKAQRLGNWLVGIMIAGLVTVSIEQAVSRIPGIEAVQGGIDATKIIIEVALVVARAVCAVLYGVTIHSLETHQHTQASNQPPDSSAIVDMVNTTVDQRTQNLCTQMATLTEQVDVLCTQVSTQSSSQGEGVHNFVDMDQFKQLSSIVYKLSNTVQQMHVSVTEVHNNVLQISGNIGSSDASVHTATPSQLGMSSNGSLPALSVPGVPQDKVNQILTLFLQGTNWRDMPGNYSRTIKPIREAYESYVHTTASEV